MAGPRRPRRERTEMIAEGERRKWRRKPLESLKTDAEMAPRPFARGAKGESITRISYDMGIDHTNFVWGRSRSGATCSDDSPPMLAGR